MAESGAQVVVRVPCIPGVNDDDDNIKATAHFARELGLSEIHLLAYNAAAPAEYAWLGQPYALPGLATQDAEKMKSLAAICCSFGLQAQIIR